MAQVGDGKLMEESRLPNGVIFRLCDHTRPLAGDRWVVGLRVEARIAVPPDLFKQIREEDPELLAATREALGGELILNVERERNFVAEEEKSAVFAELLNRIRNNLLGYLHSPAFPRKLFERRYEEQKNKIILDRKMNLIFTDEEKGVTAASSSCLPNQEPALGSHPEDPIIS